MDPWKMTKPPMRAATLLPGRGLEGAHSPNQRSHMLCRPPTVDSGALDRAGNAAGARQVRREEAGADGRGGHG